MRRHQTTQRTRRRAARAPQAHDTIFLRQDSVFPHGNYDVQVRDEQDPAPFHTHDFDELAVVTGGFGVHVIDREEFPLIRGDAFVIRGEHVHAFRNVQNLRLVNVLFTRERFHAIQEQCRDIPGFHALFVLEPQLRQTQHFKAKLHLSVAQLNHIMHLIGLLQQELRSRAPGSTLVAESLVRIIVITICRYYSAADTGDCHALVRVSKAIRHLEDHSTENHSLDALARVAGMGTRTFRRAFKQTTGCAPSAYLLRLRIERAAELLARPDTNVTGVAFDVGFDNSSYFAQQFRKVMGMTPRAYMTRQRTLQP